LSVSRSRASRTALLAALLVPLPAAAIRPTEGGLYAYDPTDTVVSWDEPTGRVRVHYSIDGPSVTLLADADASGVPDFVEDVGFTAVDVLDLYAGIGLRPPVSEDDLGLGPLGGSAALDVYLVDFAGVGDGHFGTDACTTVPRHCAGFLMVENDFAGYGYANLPQAVDVLASHELFHGVQDAYDSGQAVWFAEGTAVWGERQFDSGSLDFLAFADEYLRDTGRSLDVPPLGPVPAWAYGTALWWDFLTLRHDPGFMHDLLLATETTTGEPADTLAGMAAALEARGDALEAAWTAFASWNLATGGRAGAMPSYPYAASLIGVTAEAEGAAIDDDNRFYPLAATYYRLDHGGGPMWFGVQTAAPALRFALHAVAGGAADGPVEPALAAWTPEGAGAWALLDGADLPPGGYWIVGTQPAIADASVKVRVCIGDRTAATACAPAGAGDGGASEGAPVPASADGGCSCAVGGAGPAFPGTLFALSLAFRPRRRRR
jgi:hypothetical protein